MGDEEIIWEQKLNVEVGNVHIRAHSASSESSVSLLNALVAKLNEELAGGCMVSANFVSPSKADPLARATVAVGCIPD